VELLDQLRSPLGESLLAAADAALVAGDELGVGARLRTAGHPAALVAAAFSQAELRRRAAGAFSRAAHMLFTRAGLEQSSAEALARHRAARYDGFDRVADLCTGMGGDLLALAASAHPLVAVDQDAAHLRMAVHNALVYAPEAEIDARRADVRDVDLTGVQAVFVDPARRSGTRRFAAGVGEPPLEWCFGLVERVPAVGVKAAPGLPTGLVPPGWEIEFVADGRDLKEAALYAPPLATGVVRRATVLLPTPPGELTGAAGATDRPVSGRVVTMVGEPDVATSDDQLVGEPATFLYDPSPAVTRAGLVGALSGQLGAWQIDPMIAFLTSDRAVETPFARLLRVEASLPFDVRRLAQLLRPMGIGGLDLRRRGLAGDVEALRRRLLPARRDLVPGGPAVTVVMTRRRGQPWALVCTSPKRTG
jgi:hypothetical protein